TAARRFIHFPHGKCVLRLPTPCSRDTVSSFSQSSPTTDSIISIIRLAPSPYISLLRFRKSF
ncbi:hypothetical protein O181_055884, partial [Austropuccinia psidii MF-1]|nr:hypothetical protein [Austropuccinia psidii MF-1]